MHPRAIFELVEGPNKGDTVSLDRGTCRLLGRHLAEGETSIMDGEGNRMLDAPSSELLTSHLHQLGVANDNTGEDTPSPSVEDLERGPDIILSDASISRAHAMLFFDNHGVGAVDLASTNGTRVNGDAVASRYLGNGDVLQVGHSRLELRLKTER